MTKKITALASLLGILAIVLGAFGAHALKKIVSLEQLSTFETGVKYQMYHALFLLFVGTTTFINDKVKNTILILSLVGIIFFSGSIYLLSTMSITGINFKAIGIFTPIGGVFLISSWGVLLYNSINKKS
jgi:uncharacterized membrane protein YgdD (TMEM256/DUF423 family)